jgi:hypothetical protein
MGAEVGVTVGDGGNGEGVADGGWGVGVFVAVAGMGVTDGVDVKPEATRVMAGLGEARPGLPTDPHAAVSMRSSHHKALAIFVMGRNNLGRMLFA